MEYIWLHVHMHMCASLCFLHASRPPKQRRCDRRIAKARCWILTFRIAWRCRTLRCQCYARSTPTFQPHRIPSAPTALRPSSSTRLEYWLPAAYRCCPSASCHLLPQQHTHTHTHTLLQQEYYEYIILDAEHELNFEVMKRLGEPQWLVSVTLTHKYTLSLSLPHVHPHTLFDVMVRLGEP